MSKAYFIALAVVAVLAFSWHHIDKSKAVSTAIALKDKEILEMQLNAKVEKEKIESTLNKELADKEEEKNAKIKTINDKLSVALSELRNRPKRSSTNTSATESAETCTGRELFREDAEFLTREASRADEVAIERDFYYEQYENARRNLAGQE